MGKYVLLVKRLRVLLIATSLVLTLGLVSAGPALALPGNVTGTLSVRPHGDDCCDVSATGIMNGWIRGDLTIRAELKINGAPAGSIPNFCVDSTECLTGLGTLAAGGDRIDLIVTGLGPDAPPGGAIYTATAICPGDTTHGPSPD